MTLDEALHIAKTQAWPGWRVAGEALRVLVAELDKRTIASAESDAALSTLGPDRDGWVLVPREPTINMLVAARNWSYRKYGKPIGDEASKGCYAAMLAAIPKD